MGYAPLVPEVTDEVDTPAREISSLPPLQARILCWRYGIEGERLDEAAIAKRLRVSAEEVRLIADAALVELAFRLVSVDNKAA